MSDQDGIELRWILGVIRRWMWLILGVTVLAAIGGYAFTSRMPLAYKATTTLLVDPAKDTTDNNYNLLVAGERLAYTYSEMIKERPILDDVIYQLGLSESAESLAERIIATPVENTQLIRVTVTDASPTQAALLANTIATTIIEHVHALHSERYVDSITNAQEKMDSMAAVIQETQDKIDAQNTIKIEEETEANRLESLLTEYRNDYRSLQQSYQSMQMAVAQVMEKVKIVEAAYTPETPLLSLPSANVMLLLDRSLITGQGDVSSLLISQQLALTYGKMLTGKPVLEAAIAELEISKSAEELAKRVKVDAIPGTQMLRLRVEDEDAVQAMQLANAIGNAFIAQVRMQLVEPYNDRLLGLQTEIDDLSTSIGATQESIRTHTTKYVHAEQELARLQTMGEEYRNDFRTLDQDYEQLLLARTQAANALIISEPAYEPESPDQNRTMYIILIVLAAALLSLGISFLIEYLDDVIRTTENVSRVLGLATFGTIGRLSNKKIKLIVVDQPRSPIAEDFRVLATNIRYSGLDKPLRTILITSPQPVEGKSMIVANLAAAFAQSKLKIAIVDADLRLPGMGHYFNLDQSNGLTPSLLDGKVDGRLQTTGVDGLMILPSGDLPPNPAEVLGSARMRNILDQLLQEVDLVIIDCPPVLPLADAKILASIVDGVLLVLRAGKTRGQTARESVMSLRQVGANIVGVVLNSVPNKKHSYYYSRYQKQGKGLRSNSHQHWEKQPAVALPESLDGKK